MSEEESRNTSEPTPNKSPLVLTKLNYFFWRELFFLYCRASLRLFLKAYRNDNNTEGQCWVLLGPDGNLENVSDSDLLVPRPSKHISLFWIYRWIWASHGSLLAWSPSIRDTINLYGERHWLFLDWRSVLGGPEKKKVNVDQDNEKLLLFSFLRFFLSVQIVRFYGEWLLHWEQQVQSFTFSVLSEVFFSSFTGGLSFKIWLLTLPVY